MKHYTRRERRIRRGGYDEGYNAGYKQGLHDGNPFIAIAEAATKVTNSLVKTFADPAFQEACRKYVEEQKKDSHQDYWDHVGEVKEEEQDEEQEVQNE
jgi:hypothetical protein